MSLGTTPCKGPWHIQARYGYTKSVYVSHAVRVGTTYFVVCVEDDEFVVFVFCGDVCPPCLEGGCVGDDVAEKATVVVRLDHGVGAF